jgi:hypothetical protein
LLDAVGKTINSVGARIDRMRKNERPDKVIMCILTDGMENASREFKRSMIKDIIEKRREEDNWEFTFLAANQDAFAEAGAMGISQNMTANFNADSDGTRMAYDMINKMTTEYRTDRPKDKKRK